MKQTMGGSKLPRRAVLRYMATATGLFLVTPTLLAACGSAETTPSSAAMATAPAEAATADESIASCAEEATLSSTDKSMRSALNYVAQSVDPEKQCHACQFFKKPEDDQACGGCQILQGPIAATGYCNSWVKQSS